MLNDDSSFDVGQIVHRRLEPYGSQEASGSLTSDDLFKFVNELKHEYVGPGRVEFTQQELEWMKAQEQNARDIARAFEIPPQIVLSLSESEPDPFYLMAPRTYNMIRWLYHLAKAHHLPRRKLRKCHLRKRTRRMQRERKRYFDTV